MNKISITLLVLLTALIQVVAQNPEKSSFSLTEAQEYALQNNANILNAKLDVEIAQKKIWETTAIGLPQVNTSIGHNYFLDLPVTLIPAKVFNPQAPDGEYSELKFGTDHSTKLDLQATQLIFSGEYIVGLKASKIYKELSENKLEKTELDLKEAIAKSYELILIAEERKAIIEKNIISTQSIYKDTKALFETGFAEETDADQIQINVSTLENALVSAKRQIEVLKNLLKFQMNIPLDQNIELTDQLESILNLVNPLDLIEKPFDQTQHIDFKIIETQENLQSLSLKREKSTFLPSISAFYNYQKNMMSNDFEVFSGGNWFPTNIIGLNIQIPIFSSGQRLSKVSQARIELDKVRNSKHQVSENLNIQLLQARSEFQTANDDYNLVKENKLLSEKIFNNYLTKYKNGMVTSQDLTQSQLQYLNAENAYFQSIFNLLDAKTKLIKALGTL